MRPETINILCGQKCITIGYIALIMRILCLLTMLSFVLTVSMGDLFGQSTPDRDYINFKAKPLGFTTAITSDRDGFVWISTGYGLYRYDGTNYEPLDQLIDDAPDISTEVHCLYVDAFNQLWIFKSNLGLYRINLNTFEWRHYPSLNRNHETSFYYSMFEDKDWGLLIPHQNGLAFYEREKDTFEIQALDSIERGIRLIEGYQKNQLIITSRTQVFHYDLLTRRKREIKKLKINSRYISAIKLDPEHHLWIANWNNYDRSLLRYDLVGDSILQVFTLSDPTLPRTTNSDIWQMLNVDGYMYFNTNSSGLWRFKYTDEKMDRLNLKLIIKNMM